MLSGEGWAATPPTWAQPVTVATTLVLARQGGALVSVGAVCAYPMGFEFYLTFGFDPDPNAEWRARAPSGRVLGFHVRTTQERESATRVAVGFAGDAAVDSVTCMTRRARPAEPVLRFAGGDSVIPSHAPVLRAESRMTWLEIRYADGRARAADLNANTPPGQSQGPHVHMLNGGGSDGCDDSRRWVIPLPRLALWS
jgi:hypothetical protein